MEKIVKIFLEATVGMELETTSAYNRNGVCLSKWSDTPFNETPAIREYRLLPTKLSNFKETLEMAELVRLANPYYFCGHNDKSAGSAHCHINVEPIANEIYNYITDGSCDNVSSDNLANAMVTPAMKIMLLPFMSLGYGRKGVDGLPIRAPYRKSTLAEYPYDECRGALMKINNDVTYASYGFEFRANENSNLWVYLIPYLLYKFKTDPEFKQRATDLERELTSYIGNTNKYSKEFVSYILNRALTLLRIKLDNSEFNKLCKHIGLNDTEEEIFRLYVRGAYDYRYTSLVSNYVDKSINNIGQEMRNVVMENPFILSCEFGDLEYKKALTTNKIDYLRKFRRIVLDYDLRYLKKALRKIHKGVVFQFDHYSKKFNDDDTLFIDVRTDSKNYLSALMLGDIRFELKGDTYTGVVSTVFYIKNAHVVSRKVVAKDLRFLDI